MTQVIQLYPEQILEPEARSAAKEREVALLMRQFGFTMLQKDNEEIRAERDQWLADNGMQPLTTHELNAWRAYLPTSYWSERGKAVGQDLPVHEGMSALAFGDYDFHESVPLSVLRRMSKIGHLFDALEIRTPEMRSFDPVLWGHVINSDGTRRIYALARWAESATHFISGVADLEKILAARRGALSPARIVTFSQMIGHLSGSVVLTGLAVGFFTIVMSLIFSDLPSIQTMVVFGAFIGAAAALTDIVTQRKRLWSLEKSDPHLVRFV